VAGLSCLYLAHYSIHYRVERTLLSPDQFELAGWTLAAGVSPMESTGEGLRFATTEPDACMEVTDLDLPAGPNYLLQIEMSIASSLETRVTWATSDGVFHPADVSIFQTLYHNRLAAYNVMIDLQRKGLHGLRIYPSDKPTDVTVRSIRIVSLR